MDSTKCYWVGNVRGRSTIIATIYIVITIINLARDVAFGTLTGHWFIVVGSSIIMPSSNIIHAGMFFSSFCLLHGATKYSKSSVLLFLVMVPIFATFLLLDLSFKIFKFMNYAIIVCWYPNDRLDTLEQLVLLEGKNICLSTLGYVVSCIPGWIFTITSIYFWRIVYTYSKDLK